MIVRLEMPIDYETEPVSFYKIVPKNKSISGCYVGHTGNFKRRLIKHKSNCYNTNTREYNFPVYQYIRGNGGWNEWEMIELDNKICDTKKNAVMIEQKYMDELKSDLNGAKSYTGIDNKNEYMKQYRQERKAEIKEYNKKYKEEHKSELSEKQKEYYKQHTEERTNYQKKYTEINAEKLKQYQMNYRLKKSNSEKKHTD